MADNSASDMRPTSFSDSRLTWDEPKTEPVSATGDPTPSVDTADSQTGTPPPADATAPPAQDSQSAAAPPETGPIPFDRHQAVLNAEREKYSALEAKWQRVQWAETLAESGRTPEQIRESLDIYDGFDRDPVGSLETLYERLRQHPQTAALVRSFAGRVLAGHHDRAPQDEEPKPDFIDNATGKGVFSDERLKEWQEWRERQFTARLNQQLSPLIQSHQQAERQRQDAEALQSVKTLYDTFESKPHFKEHKPVAAEYVKAEFAKGRTDFDVIMHEAYAHILTTKVLPTMTETGKAQAVADLQRQAAASSAVKPTAAAAGTPKRYKSFMDMPPENFR